MQFYKNPCMLLNSLLLVCLIASAQYATISEIFNALVCLESSIKAKSKVDRDSSLTDQIVYQPNGSTVSIVGLSKVSRIFSVPITGIIFASDFGLNLPLMESLVMLY